MSERNYSLDTAARRDVKLPFSHVEAQADKAEVTKSEEVEA